MQASVWVEQTEECTCDIHVNYVCSVCSCEYYTSTKHTRTQSMTKYDIPCMMVQTATALKPFGCRASLSFSSALVGTILFALQC